MPPTAYTHSRLNIGKWLMLSLDKLTGCIEIMNSCLYARAESDLEDIWLAMQSLCNIESLTLSVAESVPTNSGDDSGNFYAYGVNAEWMSLYMDNEYAHIDPVVRYCKIAEGVFSWSRAIEHFGVETKEFVDMAHRFGLNDGFAVGVPSHLLTGMASVVSVSVNHKYFSLPDRIMVETLLPHVNAILNRPGFLSSPDFTSKQAEVLKWASSGKSHWETGVIMGISERTVKFHFDNIFKKLGVRSRTEAIRKARIMGVVSA
jgi:LuxR family transcriptional regulator, quorum-sensing system regulator CviR